MCKQKTYKVKNAQSIIYYETNITPENIMEFLFCWPSTAGCGALPDVWFVYLVRFC